MSWLCGRESEQARDRHPEPPPPLLFLLLLCLRVRVHLVEQTSVQREFKWAEARHLSFSVRRDPCVRMTSNSKSVNSTAIKAEIKRHESLQSAINRLSKQFERVADQQLRSGLKVYLHSIQGKLIVSLYLEKTATHILVRWLTGYKNLQHGLTLKVLTLMHILTWYTGKILCRFRFTVSLVTLVISISCGVWGNMIAQVIDIFLCASCLS